MHVRIALGRKLIKTVAIHVIRISDLGFLFMLPGHLGTRKRPGTSCKIEIHFWFKITQYLFNGIRFLFQICPRYSFPCARHRHKVSNSFTKESGRDKCLKVRNWISILLLVPVLLLTVRSPGCYVQSAITCGIFVVCHKTSHYNKDTYLTAFGSILV